MGVGSGWMNLDKINIYAAVYPHIILLILPLIPILEMVPFSLRTFSI